MTAPKPLPQRWHGPSSWFPDTSAVKSGTSSFARAASTRPHQSDGAGRDKAVAPFIAPHRLAQIVPGHAIDAPEDGSDRTADSLTTLAIIIGLAVTAYGCLFWLIGLMAGVL